MDNAAKDLLECIHSLEKRSETRPSHYKQKSTEIEPIDYMRANFTPEELVGFLQGNLIKYIFRYQRKNGVQDLRKARQYLDWMIDLYAQHEIKRPTE